jgi:AcrR family transcriptional regulator
LESPEQQLKSDLVRQPGQRQVNRERRLAEILGASLQVFAAEGYAGYSLRKVAALADIRLNTIQHHFGDLNSLLLATIRTMMDGYVEQYSKLAAAETLSPRDRLLNMLDEIFGESTKPEVRKFFFEMWTFANHDPAGAILVEKAYSGYLGAIADLVRGVEPELAPFEARVFASMIASWSEGLVVLAEYGRADDELLSKVVSLMKTQCLSLFQSADEGDVPRTGVFDDSDHD